MRYHYKDIYYDSNYKYPSLIKIQDPNYRPYYSVGDYLNTRPVVLNISKKTSILVIYEGLHEM
jgi:hypothetical protein